MKKNINNKKWFMNICMIALSMGILCTCGGTENTHTNKKNTVEQVINEQIDNAEKENEQNDDINTNVENSTLSEELEEENTTEIDNKEKTSEDITSDANKDESIPEDIAEDITADENENVKKYEVDYDLSEMNSDMIYATVYQMMVDPDSYVGKKFCIEGTFYSEFIEATGNRYDYCLIADAAACCAQGLEFVWGDGSHVYPDEFPEVDSDILVVGVFETYREEGDENLYCRLRDAEIEIK